MWQTASRRVMGSVLRTAGCSTGSRAAVLCPVRSRSISYTYTTPSTESSTSTSHAIAWESNVTATDVPETCEETDLALVAGVFRGLDINLVVRRLPAVLHPERLEELSAKVMGLQEALPGVDVPSLVVAVPEVMEERLDEDLLPRIAALRTLLPGGQFLHAVSMSPQLLLHGPRRLQCSSLEV